MSSEQGPRSKAGAASAKARRRRAVQAYAPLVPLMYRLRNAGLSLAQVAERLNAEGHATNTGKPWRATQVWRALRWAGR
jgi:hypothetical protein